ncbi:MAG: hypothetical protein CMD01_03165 [Flavobacteriales bacterium]|nr:hypothetical protein [Flavobacteriales bacterium]
MSFIKHIALLLCLVNSLSFFGQKTKVSGLVKDSITSEALPFVNVFFKGTKVGVTTDLQGKFSIETFYATDSIVISFIGYKKVILPIQKDKAQQLTVYLNESFTSLQEITIISSDVNPAHAIIDNVLKNKKINNREKLDAYQYEVYNKIQFDINNLTDEFKNTKAFRKFNFIFDNVDTTGEKEFLPLFVTESLSDYYFRKSPKTHKEIIKGSNVSGVDNESISQFTGDMYQQVNIYDNYLTIFRKNFVSPIANQCLSFYKYYLIDSLYMDGYWCYQLDFTPKRKGELTFEGTMWVHDTTYAIKKVKSTIAKDANINFVNNLQVTQTFKQVEKEVWMLTKDELFIDFQWTKKTLGFYGKKTTSYDNFIINCPKEEPFYSGAENVFISDSANIRDDNFWVKNRHDSLTKQQQQVYKMIDTLRKLPVMRTYADVIYLLATGYKVFGKFEVGEYTSLYSYNEVEGHRFRGTVRTSNDFSTRIELSAFGAYGLLDKRIKYGAGTRFFITKKPRRLVQLVHKKDVEQIGISSNAYNNSGVVSSLFRRNPFNKFIFNTETRFSYTREWFHGLSSTVLFRNSIIEPIGVINFFQSNNNGIQSPINNINTSEITFQTRFAYNEKYISGEFDRVSLGTKFPIIEINYGYGIPNLLESQYEFHRIKLSFNHKIPLGILGKLNYQFSAGKIFGNIPFPLLEVHPGNETWSYNDEAFNMMNIGEFISNEYVTWKIENHFDGLFLNKFPLLKKLKWREVATFQGVWGRLNNPENLVLDLPEFSSSLERKPYIESSFGIENIFKFLRVDVIWRLSYLDNEFEGIKVAPFGVRAKLQFDF